MGLRGFYGLGSRRCLAGWLGWVDRWVGWMREGGIMQVVRLLGYFVGTIGLVSGW